jgi:hypothetical protein
MTELVSALCKFSEYSLNARFVSGHAWATIAGRVAYLEGASTFTLTV